MFKWEVCQLKGIQTEYKYISSYDTMLDPSAIPGERGCPILHVLDPIYSASIFPLGEGAPWSAGAPPPSNLGLWTQGYVATGGIRILVWFPNVPDS